jgi:hypothetical protein
LTRRRTKGRFFALDYTAYCYQAGVQAADPVNAWTDPLQSVVTVRFPDAQ